MALLHFKLLYGLSIDGFMNVRGCGALKTMNNGDCCVGVKLKHENMQIFMGLGASKASSRVWELRHWRMRKDMKGWTKGRKGCVLILGGKLAGNCAICVVNLSWQFRQRLKNLPISSRW
jgi:hypothetical protein